MFGPVDRKRDSENKSQEAESKMDRCVEPEGSSPSHRSSPTTHLCMWAFFVPHFL
jgi:hypothetical protein